MEKYEIKKKKFIGTTTDNLRVYVTLEIKWHQEDGETITHEIANGYYKVSLVGEIGSNCFGQCYEEICSSKYKKETVIELNILRKLWEEWHLNDMKAACIHQNSFNPNVSHDEFKRLQAIETAKCPNKYNYGSKWLVKPVPEDVLSELIKMFK